MQKWAEPQQANWLFIASRSILMHKRRVFFTSCQPPVKKREIGKHAHGYKAAVKLRSLLLLKVLMGYVPPYGIACN